MITWLKSWWRRPTPIEVARYDLEIAQLKKLDVESALEDANAAVSRQTVRIIRLKQFLADNEENRPEMRIHL